ncbi:MAG: membrane protein insertase YidC [Alphaproteobacteria bacterium]
MQNNTNLILAVILSVIILVGFQYLYVKPQQEQFRQQVLAENQAKPPQLEAAGENAAPRDRATVVATTPRVVINTPELRGSINLKGARLDDLALAQYRENLDPNSSHITLLSPSGSAGAHRPYYAEFSWLGDKSIAVPTAQTEWKSAGGELSQSHPVKLTWDNNQGLVFERTISVDEHFMFTITDHVTNKGQEAVTLYPFGVIARQGHPAPENATILHEGPIGFLNGSLEEANYEKLMDNEKKTIDSEGGWLGITDKYWLVALVPNQTEKLTASFAYNRGNHVEAKDGYFQTDYRSAPVIVAPGAKAEHVTHLFAGAKKLRVLDQYADEYNIPHFDKAIDFGWFYFLTKPFLYLLAFLGRILGSFGLAILAFTVLLKLVTLPLSQKSYHSMARMKALQPEMKKLQERFADDKMRQSQEMMELYRREKVNPMAGCWPQLIQIPIFFALYKVLYVGIELRQAPFYGWIHDMSIPDPTSLFNLFGLFPWSVPSALHIGVWPVLMGLSMLLQQRLSPQPPDKMQARMFMFMPILFTYLLAQMPAGLVIYWTWSNLLSILQQTYIMRSDLAKQRG